MPAIVENLDNDEKIWNFYKVEFPDYVGNEQIKAFQIELCGMLLGIDKYYLRPVDKSLPLIGVSETWVKGNNPSKGDWAVLHKNGVLELVQNHWFVKQYMKTPIKMNGLKLRARCKDRNAWFEVLSVVVSELNGREKRAECNNGMITIWRTPAEADFEIMIGEKWYPLEL
jgi:hypothetical protein